ncbi:MAG: deoxyguanosinetriphosphate triphosphohydrolase [Rhodospirillaceae bacterium]|jgi:dGTPase|nr:deoxyguanosinetriphosphate triphosphohydrolase [Rhodospirillaceae bacterium]MBT5812677.1 deoxyguanosinetriphosphate triphosphohydrolase [Rhodospirillaceae bacterium]
MTLAPYATLAATTRGRLYPEPESRRRSAFQRDRDRIIHSTAFRRLKHKTQVFIAPEGDHYRTRLTHSLEVAQIGRSLARALQLDEDLVEAIALAHDIGHPPFGHAGEEALNKVSRYYGGFDHNAQTLRVLTEIEQRYADFDGLNLSWETLEGIVKHNGPVRLSGQGAPNAIHAFNNRYDLELSSYPSAEAQIAAISDDIAYNNHDLDDGLRADIFTLGDLRDVPHVAAVFKFVGEEYPHIDRARLIHEAVRRLIGEMVEDVLGETVRRLKKGNITSVGQIRALGQPVVAFSESMREKERLLKSFLFKNLYRHGSVTEETDRGRLVVQSLFNGFMKHPELLPTQWRDRVGGAGSQETARVIIDYIAGMTDRYALTQWKDLTEKGACAV